jgi:N-carbamoylputrescine amidase
LVVGLIQARASAEKEANVRATLDRIREAADRGAELVCTQELFASPYFCQIEDRRFFELAEPIPGPTTQALADVASEKRITLIGSLFERRAPGVYHNTSVVLGPDGALVGRYRKMHIPDDPQYYEKFYFTPGDLGFVAYRTPRAVVGPLVCWDQWYPEAARLTALRGAELLVYPTAIGWLPEDKVAFGKDQVSAWQTMQRSHAIANGVFVLAINRVGVEREGERSIEFWGHSFVADPFGVVLAEADEGEETLIVECDLGRLDRVRTAWPFFRDRRIDAYGDLERRWVGLPDDS